MNETRRGLLGRTWTMVLRGAVVLGAAAFLVEWKSDAGQAWAGLLVANALFAFIAVGAGVFLAVQEIAGAGWPAALRRVPEAMTAYLPIGALIGLLTLFGTTALYPWAGAMAGDPLVAAKSGYLAATPFALRAMVYWAAWVFLARALVKRARRRAFTNPGAAASAVLPAIFLVVFAFTFTLASVDWLMSIEPRWSSTLYPWYVFAGAFLSALAAIGGLTAILHSRGLYQELNEHHWHNLGKYMFAFSCFWAYLWYCQYLLIWYSNIPDETAHYVRRLAGGWTGPFWLNPVVSWIVPFILLLRVADKKNPTRLMLAAAVILAGRWLDLYLLIAPGLQPRPAPAPANVFVLAGVAALFALAFDRDFRSAPPLPVGDPYLDESLHFEGV